jgi:ubiquinone/menaquinone biosynthesis C-methylase UbiE
MDEVVDPGMRAYYDARADEYDDWWLDDGLFGRRERPGWTKEVQELVGVIGDLPPADVLDVGCGTGFLTRHLRGNVTAIDQSPRMVAVAAERMAWATVIQGEAVPLPFADGAFERIVAAHFYGHLQAGECEAFLTQARRVAGELVIIDSARRPDVEAEQWQKRTLNDGSQHRVYKRYFTADGLATELGGAEVLHAGRWFVAVRG